MTHLVDVATFVYTLKFRKVTVSFQDYIFTVLFQDHIFSEAFIYIQWSPCN